MAAYVEAFTDSGLTLYVMIRNAAKEVWNTDSGAFEAWNASNWTDYAISMTEDSQSGFYWAAVPAAIGAGRLTLLVYNQLTVPGSPAAGDQKFGNSTGLWDGTTWESGWSTTSRTVTGLGASATVDVGKINGVAAAAVKLGISANTIITGTAAAGTLSVSQMTTDLTFTIAKLLYGRVIYFTSGALTGRAAAIADYTVAGGKLTFASPLPVAPTAGDTFDII